MPYINGSDPGACLIDCMSFLAGNWPVFDAMLRDYTTKGPCAGENAPSHSSISCTIANTPTAFSIVAALLNESIVRYTAWNE